MQTVARLYNYFQPTHYALDLTLEREKRTFTGTVSITGQKISNEDSIRFHAKDLVISSVTIEDSVTTFSPGENDEIVLTAQLPKGTYTITLAFNGTITDGMHGLYPCYYEHDGVKKELLATQFESHHAREVFPCVDEPEAKATFDLTITTEDNVTVLSNMPVKKSQATAPGLLQTHFETSPKMSSYLLAFVVGELHKKTAHTKDGVEVNIYATKVHDSSKFDFGLDAAVRSIEFFDDYFKVPYPLPKADHVALPDFSSGAMENWGLITYRESCLLADKKTAQSTREVIATVIAHETSHQWFGNLVTMRWWDDLWLNESFATVMEYIATDAMYPSWQMWDTYASHETLSALRRDQLPGVQAVKCVVHHPDEISTLFDPSIVYAKGARLLKMLHDYIGDTAFRNGLQEYFKTHQYSNTVGDDLWGAFSQSSGKDISLFMEKWINQSGFPVVSLDTTPDGYDISQKQFVIGQEPDERNWIIPLGAHNKDFPAELDKPKMHIKAEHSLPLLNVGNGSHFITHYDDTAFELIHQALVDKALAPVDRLALLHETTLLGRSDRLSTGALVRLLDAYTEETEHSVWDIISLALGDLKWFVEAESKAEADLKKFITSLAEPQYKKLGFDPKPSDSEQDSKLRGTIVSLLAYADYEDVITKSLHAFDKDHFDKMDNELRPIIFGVVTKHGTEDHFQQLLKLHETTTDIELRDDAVSGLTLAKTSERIHTLIDRLTDSQVVKPQDVSRWYIYLLRNRYAREDAWEWMTSHWQWIRETFGGDKSYDDFARYSASILPTHEWLKKYETFFTPFKGETALARAISIGLVEIKNKADWIEHDRADVVSQLAQETE